MRAGSAWVFLLAFACNSNANTSSDGGGGSGHGGAGSDGGTSSGCELTLNGSAEPIFEPPTSRIRVFAGSFFTVVEGLLLDGERREIHTEGERRGDCRLLTYSPSFCDPSCENPAICVRGACQQLPEPISAGALSVVLGENRKVEVQPDEVGRYYFGTEELGYDAVPSVAVSAPGDEAPGFELEACLTPPPQPTQNWDALLRGRAPGEDVELAWSNPVQTARVYLRMTTCIGTHGGISPVEIECEGRDVGKLTLPGPYLDALYEDGWGRGECGSNDVWRYHASRAGSVQLRAESAASFYFQPGRDAP